MTASNFGTVLKNIKPKRRLAKSLLKTSLGNYDMNSVHAVQWGIHHEATAIKVFEAVEKVSVARSGI